MSISTRAVILAAGYLLVVGAAISYEIGIRVQDPAHSEFAGWLSAVLTLPSVLLVNFSSGFVLGVRMGDSNTSFVLIAGTAALLNVAIAYAFSRRVRS